MLQGNAYCRKSLRIFSIDKKNYPCQGQGRRGEGTRKRKEREQTTRSWGKGSLGWEREGRDSWESFEAREGGREDRSEDRKWEVGEKVEKCGKEKEMEQASQRG